jgi:hypothetical protein
MSQGVGLLLEQQVDKHSHFGASESSRAFWIQDEETEILSRIRQKDANSLYVFRL